MAMPKSAEREDAGIALARYAAGLKFEDLPTEVVAKVKELILDSFGVSLAGSTALGTDLAFTKDHLITCVVVDHKKVAFEGETTSLTAAALTIVNRMGCS